MELPQDGFMLLSVVNMKLRDQYASLSALCEDMDVEEEDIATRLAQIGFHYDQAHNRFQ